MLEFFFTIILHICIASSLLLGQTAFANASFLLNQQRGITVNADNSMLIADFGNHRVLSVAAGSTTGIVVAGGSGLIANPVKAFFNTMPSKVYVLNGVGSMWWSNSSSTDFLIFGTSGSNLNQMSGPAGFDMDSNDNFYIADTFNCRILFWPFNASSGVIIAGGSCGSGIFNLSNPADVFVDENARKMYVADRGNHRIVLYSLGFPNGTSIAGGNGQGTGQK